MARPNKAELQKRQKLEAKHRQVPFSSLSSRKNKTLPPCSDRTGGLADCHVKKVISPLFHIKNLGVPMQNYVSRRSCGSSTALKRMGTRCCDPFLSPYATLFASTITTAGVREGGSCVSPSAHEGLSSASAQAGAQEGGRVSGSTCKGLFSVSAHGRARVGGSGVSLSVSACTGGGSLFCVSARAGAHTSTCHGGGSLFSMSARAVRGASCVSASAREEGGCLFSVIACAGAFEGGSLVCASASSVSVSAHKGGGSLFSVSTLAGA